MPVRATHRHLGGQPEACPRQQTGSRNTVHVPGVLRTAQRVQQESTATQRDEVPSAAPDLAPRAEKG